MYIINDNSTHVEDVYTLLCYKYNFYLLSEKWGLYILVYYGLINYHFNISIRTQT